MTLPKGWQRDPRVTQLYTQRNISIMRRFHNHLTHWESCICKYRRQGLKPKEALHKASADYVSNMIHKCGIPHHKQWNGRPSSSDQNCSLCDLLFKAGVLEQPGKLRYLGEFYAGREKVTKEFHEEDHTYTADVEFANYLAAWRCDVCGNEFSDGY